MWLVAHKKILTLDNLQRRGWLLANRCYMCHSAEESINHLLIECDFAKQVWRGFGRVCSILAPPTGDILMAIQRWSSDLPDNLVGWIGFCALHVISWQVWLERNSRVFRDRCLGVADVLKKALLLIVDNLIAHGKISREEGMGWMLDVRRSLDPSYGFALMQ
ncbi:unnamed protein product [Linum tenue]|nr:unnamed protein product [Linum tenue]